MASIIPVVCWGQVWYEIIFHLPSRSRDSISMEPQSSGKWQDMKFSVLCVLTVYPQASQDHFAYDT